MKNPPKSTDKKDLIKQVNWEKVGVYIAIITLIVLFATKVNELSERISKLEGKLEILIERK